MTGGPLKPDFGLSGDVQIFLSSVIPTGADHRESGDPWSGGTWCLSGAVSPLRDGL
jgi:hypothetical protein